MSFAICQVCWNSLFQEVEPIVGAILVCDHCSSFFQVLRTQPLELQLLGTTGELEDPDDERQD
jgi:hypothetical protein